MHGSDNSPTQQFTRIEPGPARPPWWRSRSTWAVGLSALAVLSLALVAFVALRPDDTPDTVDNVSLPTPTVPLTTAAPTTVGSTASASATPSPSKTTKKPVPTAPPTKKPPAAEKPPAPQPTASPQPSCTPTYDGQNAPKDQVRSALLAAGAKEYWRGVTLPAEYEGPLVPITVPPELMKAIAWQESGWQSAIVACDGGLGTMQVMAGTVSQVNLRFGMNYTIPLTLKENTELGANYLEWLIMYFGLYYFGQNFDVYTKAPIGPDGMELELRDVVIAAYNVGPGAVEAAGNTLSVPNWNYVNAVEKFMTSCPCDAL